jgi:hypothetical protein
MDRDRRREAWRIVGLCVLASIVFGVAFDLLSCRACVEYFTIAHPPVFRTADPILLGLAWGVYATWWMGAIFGVLLAAACTAGPRPPIAAGGLVRPLVYGLGGIYVSAVLVWIAVHSLGGWAIRHHGSNRPDPELDRRMMASALAHGFAYNAAGILGIVLAVLCWRRRRRSAAPPPRSA